MFQNSLKWNLYGVKFVEEFEKYDFHKLKGYKSYGSILDKG